MSSTNQTPDKDEKPEAADKPREAPKPATELHDDDLDKVSGGLKEPGKIEFPNLK
jgi:hypothetical protein